LSALKAIDLAGTACFKFQICKTDDGNSNAASGVQ
jgi:hypothetical protein